jgi:hypothetical protein
MKFRQVQLLAATAIMTAGTKVIDINIKDVISRLFIIVIATNNNNTPVGHPTQIVKQVDLVDGSYVLHSMRGCYTAGVAFYGTAKQPHMFLNYRTLGKCKATIPINFGRELWDRELALDPGAFNNLQLKIEHDYELGGNTLSDCTIEVWADVFDDRPADLKGFLMAKSHWTKTLVVSTTDYVDLPTDHPIRLVMPAALSKTEEPNVNIASFKLSEEQDKRVLIECNAKQALKLFEADYPLWSEMSENLLVANADKHTFCSVCKDVQLQPIMSEDSDGIIHAPWSGGYDRVCDGSAGGTITTRITGRSAFGIIPLPMGRRNVIDDWWNTPELGSARIKMVTGAGDVSSLYELLLQQYRTYA